MKLKKAKKLYYSDKIRDCHSRKNSWEILKLLLPNKSTDSFNSMNSKNDKIANEFNKHFANVAASICTNEYVPILEERPVCYENSFELSPVDIADVLKEIFALKNKKSTGVDGISTFVLKLCGPEIVRSITYLINRSISEGAVPTRWKIGKIIPLFKKGDKANPDHYRPISLLPCVSKLLERVVQRQLTRFLSNNNLLAKQQSGFRSNHSTTTTLIKVTDDWLMSLDKGMYTGTVFVDLQKAFDLVDHGILLAKLTSGVGLQGSSLNWFRSYLNGRRIITSINNTLSSELPLTHGVAQGSILGPILFLIFINDMPSCFEKCSVHLYADDTVIYYSDKDPCNIENVLNIELHKLYSWMNCNKLKINCTKTVSMLTGTKHMLT